MAELDFILTNYEQGGLIDYLLEIDTIFIPSLDYGCPNFLRLTDKKEVETLVNGLSLTGPFFLMWDQISPYKLDLRCLKNDNTKYFYLMQKHGGPYIDFNSCRTDRDKRGRYITSGFIGYYSKYWIEELDDNMAVSEEIKKKYKEISKFIKKMTQHIKTKGGKRSYWVGTEALKMLQKGEICNLLDLDI